MKLNRVHIPGVYLFILVILLTGFVQAQGSQRDEQTLYLSLQEVIDRANAQNIQVEIAERDIEIAGGAYRQTNAAFLPQISLEETGVATNDPLHVFGFRLKQKSVTQMDVDPGSQIIPESLPMECTSKH